jgi:hypothetical protein
MKNEFQNVVLQIKSFVAGSQGLSIVESPLSDYMVIEQKMDRKRITLNCFDLDEVMVRQDEMGKSFLQVNFTSGKRFS